MPAVYLRSRGKISTAWKDVERGWGWRRWDRSFSHVLSTNRNAIYDDHCVTIVNYLVIYAGRSRGQRPCHRSSASSLVSYSTKITRCFLISPGPLFRIQCSPPRKSTHCQELGRAQTERSKLRLIYFNQQQYTAGELDELTRGLIKRSKLELTMIPLNWRYQILEVILTQYSWKQTEIPFQ